MSIDEKGLGGGFRPDLSIDNWISVLLREDLGTDARYLHLFLDNLRAIVDALALG